MDSSIDRHAATIAAARDDKAQLSLRESEATQAFHKKWILALTPLFIVIASLALRQGVAIHTNITQNTHP
ncbi:hypothetical protein [Helicobacter zhangjianzhongii]|uniref:Uncharacterized protein n=1 Tax=Helicobacter zhangjianzhongii TaxID=2974574 RepID=A0ACC6FT75_9HELI|nr:MULTISPECIES: hypothetical protein [unclassified Helicobacter]MDL0080360.1 hypothetical protein [Helicobacter sp. CPD2-1]MDL0082489.1 hypothetical protein [Helicobacter sp. XJK30-2]